MGYGQSESPNVPNVISKLREYDLARHGTIAGGGCAIGAPLTPVRDLTPMQVRLNELNDATGGLEQTVAGLFERFNHLMPPCPVGGECTTDSPRQPASETINRIDDNVIRVRQCIAGIQAFMQRCDC